MGNICSSCCKQSSSYEDLTPDLETRRKKQMEAAERRIAEQQSRGIKNIDAVKRQERLDQLRDQRQEEVDNRNVQSNLKWQIS
ncbi:PREDICTED: small VCP/p97-interacting protein isoform X1 [Eufriesea mexicana]|uniref:small VCP/p97-interacting protein isoform X1 n=1 Tax=Eufriesea mexicana TaxID=516756 RepID=UPI00083BA8EE|nr:PREDICTED: small VCP/p97-interacting protein isoform X1 [Eufriesea mexicana]